MTKKAFNIYSNKPERKRTAAEETKAMKTRRRIEDIQEKKALKESLEL